MTDKLISMSDLMTSFLDKIVSCCYNVSENYRIPVNYRNGQVFVLYTQNDIEVQNVISDNILNGVSRAQIEEEVNSFLSLRGISTKINAVVTTKSMMNFFNNVSVFFAKKVVRVVYPDGNSFLVYNMYASPDSVRLIAKGSESSLEEQLNDNVNKTECKQSVEDTLNAINNINNEKEIAASTQMFICSCSSSSCSCSSSSCSSSSSSYIVYMII